MTNKVSAIMLYDNTYHEDFKKKCKKDKLSISDLVTFFENKCINDQQFFSSFIKDYYSEKTNNLSAE